MRQKSLYSPAELKDLAAALAATNGTANLLGRARIREHQEQAYWQHAPAEHAERFAEPGVSLFKEPDAREIRPFPPEKAVEYFVSLQPRLNVDPARFGADMRRDAFTLAKVTDQTVLEKVQSVIRQRLETGVGIGKAPAEIDEILDQAGISSTNPQYAEMVFRTNMKDALNVGADAERMDPDVADTFPVWQWSSVGGPGGDGRNRATHLAKHGQYYPNAVSFAAVRDAEEVSPFNCRCDQMAINKWEWAELYEAGARVAQGYADVPGGRPVVRVAKHAEELPAEELAYLPAPDIVQHDHFSCGASQAMTAGKLFGVGPDTLEEWKKALGTDVEKSTAPQAIIAYLRSLGLHVEARGDMTIQDLKEAWQAGAYTICPVQDYPADVPNKATFAYGHYLGVVAVGLGRVHCQDSSADNVMRGSGSIAEPGKVSITYPTWLANWEDKDVDGNKYVRYGIVVSRADRSVPGSIP